jgi:hypothetical protein
MSGEIIEFRRHRLYREQKIAHGFHGQVRLEQQVARITNLLEELEDLTNGTTDPSSSLLVQARATLEKTRRILKPCAQLVATAAAEGDGEPQPDVDPNILERMYRDLKPHR